MKRRSSTSVKKILHSGHTFSTRDSFPPGVLPTKRHVIERILHLKNFRTFNAANDIAREIYDRSMVQRISHSSVHHFEKSSKFCELFQCT